MTSFQEVPNGGISDMEAASLFPTAIISACCDMASISDHPFTSFSQFVQVRSLILQNQPNVIKMHSQRFTTFFFCFPLIISFLGIEVPII